MEIKPRSDKYLLERPAEYVVIHNDLEINSTLIVIEGLDANGDYQTETVILDDPAIRWQYQKDVWGAPLRLAKRLWDRLRESEGE